METSPETYLMISFFDRYSYVVMTVLLLAIAFGIMNTMMMSVLERSGEIGMLRAVGMPVRVLVSMISLETLFLTVLGVPVGLCLSWILILLLQHTGIDFSKTGAEMMASFGFESRLFPVYPLSKIPGILLLIFLTSLFSALLPVWKSVQLNTLRSLQE
jgi:ABC-type antimicrobial peptide transport system permease subunit